MIERGEIDPNDNVDKILEKKDFEGIVKQIEEYEKQMLTKIITKYDFIVCSKVCKQWLKEVLPEGANIVCTPYIDDPTKIYVIKNRK